MNKKKFHSLLALDKPVYKKSVLTSLLLFGILQLILCYNVTYKLRQNLFEYNSALKKYVLTTTIADTPGSQLTQIIFPYVLYGFLIVSLILPIIFVYRSYIDSKSMYTLMRLPSNRSYYFFAKLFPSYLLVCFIWVMEFLLIVAYWGIYWLMIPKTNLPKDAVSLLFKENTMQLFYPVYHPERLLSVLAFLLAIPTIGLLGTFAERSRKAGLLSIPIIGINLLCMFFYVRASAFPFWILPCSTLLTTLTARFYIKKIQIV